MTLSLAFSPCPNDTFIFDALVNRKIDTGNLRFEVMLEDVQTLNNWAKEDKLDLSKVSYGVLPLLLDNYIVLNSGGALGKGVGPLLITRPGVDLTALPVTEMKIAIPGINTTANMLFSFAYPEAKNKEYLVFHEIEEAVATGRVDAGVIIHENRFTYEKKGLVKIMDLGTHWEETIKTPIPLGGIVIKRSINQAIQKQVDELIRKSVEYAFANYPQLAPYVKEHSQEMEESVMRQHIDLYVNNYSIDLGEAGKKAVMKLMEVYRQQHSQAVITENPVFIN